MPRERCGFLTTARHICKSGTDCRRHCSKTLQSSNHWPPRLGSSCEHGFGCATPGRFFSPSAVSRSSRYWLAPQSSSCSADHLSGLRRPLQRQHSRPRRRVVILVLIIHRKSRSHLRRGLHQRHPQHHRRLQLILVRRPHLCPPPADHVLHKVAHSRQFRRRLLHHLRFSHHHHRPVIQRMPDRRRREHNPVQQRHAEAKWCPASQCLHQPARRRPM